MFLGYSGWSVDNSKFSESDLKAGAASLANNLEYYWLSTIYITINWSVLILFNKV